jgi:hypothetical protein
MRARAFVGVVAICAVMLGAGSALAQSTPSTMAAAAAKDSPELVGLLSNALGSTPEQSAGAAGSLFGLAKSKLSPSDFSKVAAAVPGMPSLLKAAAKMGGGGAMGALGAANGLAGMASSFQKLGLKPDMVTKAVPVLTSFVSKSGGADVANLLAGVLK